MAGGQIAKLPQDESWIRPKPGMWFKREVSKLMIGKGRNRSRGPGSYKDQAEGEDNAGGQWIISIPVRRWTGTYAPAETQAAR